VTLTSCKARTPVKVLEMDWATSMGASISRILRRSLSSDEATAAMIISPARLLDVREMPAAPCRAEHVTMRTPISVLTDAAFAPCQRRAADDHGGDGGE